MDAGLQRELEEKVRGGARLTREDGIALYEADDLAWLGGLAHEVRTRANGDTASFNVSRLLTLTDVCSGPCASCASAHDRQDRDGYVMPVEEARAQATAAAPEGLTELHLLGGAHPTQPWSHDPRVLTALKEALPGVCLTAFSVARIHHVEQSTGRPAADLLDELVDAGLESLTADAEALDGGPRGRTGGQGTSWEDFSRIHRLAHGKGLITPCGMLYGQGESLRDRVDHVLRLRELQDETGGFPVFVPHLPRCLKDPVGEPATATGAEALKTFAVSRLLFDNVPHVRASWVTHGVRTAQLALLHGADDMDGATLAPPAGPDADRSGAPGAPGGPDREDIVELIRDAGFRPVERDARYAVTRVYEGADPGRRDVPQPMRV